MGPCCASAQCSADAFSQFKTLLAIKMIQSQNVFYRLSLAAALAIGLSSSKAAAIDRFIPLGDLPGGEFNSIANAISADGNVIVGTSINDIVDGYAVNGAYRWTVETGMTGLGKLPGGGLGSGATAVSADGKVVAGYSGSSSGSFHEAFRWEESTGMVGLGLIGPQSSADDVSADGKTVVGSAGTSTAFRAKYPAGVTSLGNTPGWDEFNYATAVSADGSVIVGRGNSIRGPEAFRWTEASGFVGLGDLMDPHFYSEAYGISDDGLVIVGEATRSIDDSVTFALTQAFRWTARTGLVGIGPPPTIDFLSKAFDASADGSVIVGTAGVDFDHAFVWTEVRGMVMLDELLANAGVDLTNWQLFQATSISADGNIIVGDGINPNGQREAFRADLTGLLNVPECSTLLLATIAIAALGMTKQRPAQSSILTSPSFPCGR